MRESGGMVSRF